MKLDAKSVAALKLDGKTDAIWFDEQLAGFGYRLRLGSGGQLRRSWVVQYRRAGGTRRVLLGSADVLSAAQARPAAQKILAQVALGEDPQADKASRRSADKLTLRSVVDEFLAVKETEVRPKTHGELKRYLAEGPYFRALHGMPIDTVTRKDVAAQLLAMTRRHGAATAALARGALSGFFAWAMTQGLAESNPVTGTAKLKTSTPRERVLSDDELARIWGACKDLGDYGIIVKLLIATGCRRGEVGGMCWGEINLDRGTWTIPGTRTKNGRAHSLPLTPLMLAAIADVPHRVARDQLFGVRGNGYTAWGDGKAALDKRTGIDVAWVVHDIRRSVATKMADIGIQPHIIEQILNHQSGHKSGVAGIYNRSSIRT